MFIKNKGFTLIEVILSAMILVGLLVGLISLYIYCFDLQETARNTSIALNAARGKLEEIKNSDFDSIESAYDGAVFDLNELPGAKMRTEATPVGGSDLLLDLRVVVCWRQKGGRIIGEDTVNLNGQLDSGEDANVNNRLDSPVELVTSIAKKEL